MSGNRVFIEDGSVIVEPKGLDRIWSFTRRISVPLAQVKHAYFDPSLIHGPTGVRAPGLRIPGKAAGTFHVAGRRQFWNVTDPGSTIFIALTDSAPFEQLVVTVDDPLEIVDAINAARRSNPS